MWLSSHCWLDSRLLLCKWSELHNGADLDNGKKKREEKEVVGLDEGDRVERGYVVCNPWVVQDNIK